jgi:DNA-binding SARP family transcriptional activator
LAKLVTAAPTSGTIVSAGSSVTSTVAGRANANASAGARSSTSSLSLLNAFDLRCDGKSIALPLSVQRLLAFVALHDHPLLRVFVAGSLWMDSSEERAAASLRSSLWRLHRPGVRFIDANATHLRLAADVDVDIRRGFELAHRLLDGTADVETIGADDVPLDGELLPDWYDDWVLFERERYRQVGLHALEALADRLIAAGRLGAALEAALAAVHGEPLRESAHRVLIRVHLAEGNAGEAIRQYELCRRLLQERLGLEPSARLAELVRPLTH